jgi:hypothetical protein
MRVTWPGVVVYVERRLPSRCMTAFLVFFFVQPAPADGSKVAVLVKPDSSRLQLLAVRWLFTRT